MKNEIVLYQANELDQHIEVWIQDETVWLSQQQMATLFNQTKQNVSLHINNCFKEDELDKQTTVKVFLTVENTIPTQGAFFDGQVFDAYQLVSKIIRTAKKNIFTHSHDRFLIIDEQVVYHLGASLKDLGKKWFAFSKLKPLSVQ
ncbi:MAG: hypothetical protein ORN85_03060 [Sediminibacterium sp.]|nr:hypothetical protein [Sediminibacterium sp.]